MQTLSVKTGTEVGKDRGLAPDALKIIQHGLYVSTFSYRPFAGRAVGTTDDDLNLLLWAIPHMYSAGSLNRTQVNVRKIVFGVHRNHIGTFKPYEMIDQVVPVRKGDKSFPSCSVEDYEIKGAADITGLDGDFFEV